MPDAGPAVPDLRTAREADISALTVLRTAFWSDQIAKGSRDNPDTDPEKLLADTGNLIKRARTTIFIAASDEKLVGYLLGQTKIVPGNAGSTVSSIEEIFVLPDYRRTTVARRLVENALSSFKASGSHRFQLRILERNGDGKAFWQRIGFSPEVTIYEYSGIQS